MKTKTAPEEGTDKKQSAFENAAKNFSAYVNTPKTGDKFTKINALIKKGTVKLIGEDIRFITVTRGKAEYQAVMKRKAKDEPIKVDTRQLTYDGVRLNDDTDDEVIARFKAEFTEIFPPENKDVVEARRLWGIVEKEDEGIRLIAHIIAKRLTMTLTKKTGKAQFRTNEE